MKNEETGRLAREPARLTGESMSAAVNEALRERLQQVRGKSSNEILKRIMKIAKECGPRWKKPYRSTEDGDLLLTKRDCRSDRRRLQPSSPSCGMSRIGARWEKLRSAPQSADYP